MSMTNAESLMEERCALQRGGPFPYPKPPKNTPCKDMTNAKTLVEKRYSEVRPALPLQVSARLWA